MTDVYAAVNGNRVAQLRFSVPNSGPWFADCDFEDAPDLSGKVSLSIGANLTLSGTFVPSQNGAFGSQRKARIVAGGGGWGSSVNAKPYHNDAGVKARTIAEDAAREVGESIGNFVPAADRVGNDYARRAGPASQALLDVIGATAWWVDYAGVTQVGPRPQVQLPSDAYEVLAYDPRSRVATVTVDDPAALTIGSVIASPGLDSPKIIREIDLTIDKHAMRISAWCGGSDAGESRLAGIFRGLIEQAIGGKLWGKWKYRVVSMAPDGRVNLQAVRRAAGLPDLLPVQMWPGVAGAHAELAAGAEVLVEFIGGDKTDPIITHFAGKGGAGFVPTRLSLGGDEGASDAAYKGGTVQVLLPPMVFAGTVGGSPATGVVTATLPQASGTIVDGSAKVGVHP